MLQHNKIRNFFKLSQMRTNFILKLEIHNFIINDIFIRNQVVVQEFCLRLSNFEIQLFWIVQTTSNGKMTKIKDVGPTEEIYNP